MTGNSSKVKMPSEKLLREMDNFNEELVKAGVMLAGGGLDCTPVAMATACGSRAGRKP